MIAATILCYAGRMLTVGFTEVISEAAARGLQSAVNNVAQKLGLPTLDVDGAIGTKTVGLINQIAEKHRVGTLAYAPFTVETAKRDASDLVAALDTVAASLQPSPPQPTTITTKTTQVIQPKAIKPKTKAIVGVLIGATVLGGGIAIVAAARSAKRKRVVRDGPTRKVRG